MLVYPCCRPRKITWRQNLWTQTGKQNKPSVDCVPKTHVLGRERFLRLWQNSSCVVGSPEMIWSPCLSRMVGIKMLSRFWYVLVISLFLAVGSIRYKIYSSSIAVSYATLWGQVQAPSWAQHHPQQERNCHSPHRVLQWSGYEDHAQFPRVPYLVYWLLIQKTYMVYKCL